MNFFYSIFIYSNANKFSCIRYVYLNAEWIGNPAKELDVGTIELAGSLADPHHVGRAVVVEP